MTLRKLWHDWLDAHAAKRTLADREYERGYRAGKREAEEPRRECVCPQHTYPVRLVADPAHGPGYYVCPECIFASALPVPVNTGPMRPLREETDPLVRLVQQAQARPGILMQQHYRSRVLPDRPTEHGQAVRWKQGE